MIKFIKPNKIKFKGTILSSIILLKISVDNHTKNEYIQQITKKFINGEYIMYKCNSLGSG